MNNNVIMSRVLIIGAGQIGSRHLQGVKLAQHPLDIWVCDVNKESLRIAEERYNQVTSSVAHQVHFVTDMDKVPFDIDVAIIATGSKPRAHIVKYLLQTHNVFYMVLEKFLFPRIVEYDEIENLIAEHGVKTYVNCVRRMWEMYDFIKQHLDPNYPVKMAHYGGDWGLCCNSIHYIDIFMYLTNSTEYQLNIDGLIPEISPSKREGYIELMGKEFITVSNGCQLALEADPTYTGTSADIIDNGPTHFIINESKGQVQINDKEYEIPVLYQSALSGKLVDELLANGTCALTTYSESAKYHKIFLAHLLPFVNDITGMDSDTCPIT